MNRRTYHSAVRHQWAAKELLKEEASRVTVDSAQRVVEKDVLRPLIHRTCKRNACLLTARKRDSAHTNLRLVPVLEYLKVLLQRTAFENLLIAIGCGIC